MSVGARSLVSAECSRLGLSLPVGEEVMRCLGERVHLLAERVGIGVACHHAFQVAVQSTLGDRGEPPVLGGT